MQMVICCVLKFLGSKDTLPLSVLSWPRMSFLSPPRLNLRAEQTLHHFCQNFQPGLGLPLLHHSLSSPLDAQRLCIYIYESTWHITLY